MKKYNLSEIMHKAWKLYRKGDHLTAHVDTGFLWKMAVLDVAAAKAGKAVAQLLEGGAA